MTNEQNTDRDLRGDPDGAGNTTPPNSPESFDTLPIDTPSDPNQDDAADQSTNRSFNETLDSSPCEEDQVTQDLQATSAGSSTPENISAISSRARAARRMPDRVAGYEILEEIARGGMGVVYKARQVALQRTVALKMILSGSHASDDEVQRFFSEAQAAAQLNHSAIVPIYEVGQWEDCPYFSMEYVEGQTLDEVTREHPLAPRRAAEYLLQITDAIEYAHQVGILHRDLKPGNVLLNQKGQVKVTDFGLAKQVENDSGITASGAILGTPSYMPPEQAIGSREKIGPASDVYSLGAMLYAVLTGHPPFKAASTAQTLLQVINNPPVPLRDLDPGIPRDLETICGKCLEKDPSARYASASDLSQDLRRFMSGEPIQARRANAWERSVRWCRRNPIGAALIASLAVAVLLSSLAMTYVMRTQRLERLADLQAAFTLRMDQPMLGAPYLAEVEQLQQQVAELSEPEGNRLRSRFKVRYKDFLQQQIEQPRLDSDDRAQISKSLTLVRKQDPDPAWDMLEQLLAASASRWETVTKLTTPFENYRDIFREENIDRKDDQLFIIPRDGIRYALVPTNLETRGDVLIEATFAEGWQQRRYLGVAVDCVGTGTDVTATFELLVHAPQQILSQPLFDLPSMGESESDELQIDIRRQGVWLGYTKVPRPASGPLRLAFRREGRHLQLQLNQNPPLEVEEIFPLVVTAEIATLAVMELVEKGLGNPPLGLSQLKLSRRRLPPEPHPLEAGDLAFAQGDFLAALEYFRTESPDWTSDLQKEAKYKAALTLAQLNRIPAAKILLSELAGQQEASWRFRAYAQLWTLALQAGEFEEAELISTQVLAEENFEELVVQLPRDTVDQLVAHYRSNSYQDVTNFSLPPERLAELELATVILEKLGARLPVLINSRQDLAWAYLVSDRPEQALETTRTTLEKFPYTADTLWTTLGSYPDILRANEVPYKESTEEIRRYILSDNGEALPGREALMIILIRHHLTESDAPPAFELLQRKDFKAAYLDSTGAHAEYQILLGLAHEANGAFEEAQAVWREGLRDLRQSDKDWGIWTAGKFAILGGLTEQITSEDITQILSSLSVEQLGGPFFDGFRRQFVSDAELASMIRYLYRGPRGRKLLEVQILSQHMGRESLFLIGRSIAVEMARQMVGGIEQADAFEFSSELLAELGDHYDQGQQLAWENQIGFLQASQVAMAFQGQTSFLGWGGLKSSAPKSILPPVGFMIGSHLANKGKVEVGRQILQDALQLATDGSALREAIANKLASTDTKEEESAGDGNPNL